MLETYLWGAAMMFVMCMALNYREFLKLDSNYFSLRTGMITLMSFLAAVFWPIALLKEVVAFCRGRL